MVVRPARVVLVDVRKEDVPQARRFERTVPEVEAGIERGRHHVGGHPRDREGRQVDFTEAKIDRRAGIMKLLERQLGEPVRVDEAAFRMVAAFVGVRPEGVALRLGEVLRQLGGAVAIEIGQAG